MIHLGGMVGFVTYMRVCKNPCNDETLDTFIETKNLRTRGQLDFGTNLVSMRRCWRNAGGVGMGIVLSCLP